MTTTDRLLVHWEDLPGYAASSLSAFRQTFAGETLVLYSRTNANAPFDRTIFHDLGPVHDVTGASRRTLARIIDRFQPSVALVSGWTSISRQVAWQLSGASVPVITISDNVASTQTWRTVAFRGYWRLLLRKHFDRYWVPGVRARARLRAAGVSDAVIRDGVYSIDTSAFQQSSLPARRRGPRTLLFVGQYIPRKGIPELLRGFVRSGSQWRLDLCGGGPLALLIQEYARRSPQIRDLGFVQPRDLPSIFAGADAFVLPSREDHWGVAALEAAAAGLPIICSDACGAAADLVQHGHSGFVVPARNETRFADAVAELSGLTDEVRRRMGARSRELAKKYDVTRWAQTLHQFIDELSPRTESARA